MHNIETAKLKKKSIIKLIKLIEETEKNYRTPVEKIPGALTSF